MINEAICPSCGLPNRFRAFLIRRGDVWALAEYCRKCPKLAKHYRKFLRNNLPDYREKWSKAQRARLAGCPVVKLFSVFDIIWRDGRRCYLCGKLLKISRVTLDHVIPLSRGGHHTPENVRIACEPCNGAKDNMTLAEYLETKASLVFGLSILKSAKLRRISKFSWKFKAESFSCRV